jgi:type VI secretion system secreted protein VgrG
MAHETRHVYLISSLEPEELMLQRARVTEELGRVFEIRLDLLGSDPHISVEDLVGDTMTVCLALPDGERYFNGYVARFGQGGAAGRYTRYRCTMRPFFWLLTRASDSRIFRKMSVPEIVKTVISEFGFGEVELKLQGSYPTREYTVQYRESYFSFLSRLLEEEGIYYFFRHQKDRHNMVLCDDKGSHEPVAGWEKIPFIDPQENEAPREEHFSRWQLTQQFESGAFAVNDFDFEAPRADLLHKLSRPLGHKHASLEQYDPLAGYIEAVDSGNGGDPNRSERGELFAKVRLEELQARGDRVKARGNARGPHAGATFELVDHPRPDQNREVLVVRGDYRMYQPGFDAGSSTGEDQGEDEPVFETRLLVQPAKTPFRPRRTTPRPSISGPHAAVVVGSGEIWTDKFGRVKVHFPWDRQDTEGCWVRVAQVWAGSGWGGIHVPRVGQEVIVEFVEGDPDRPIITGRVYNGANPPPFGMPEGATKSGLLSRSSKGGSADHANEVSFEDKKGEEVLHIHAEKDMSSDIENDQAHSVGHDRTRSVGNDETIEIGHDRKKSVKNNQSESVGVDKSISVGSNHKEEIGADMNLTVGSNRTEKIGSDQSLTIGMNQATKVAINSSEMVGVAKEIMVGGAHSLTVGAGSDTKVGGSKGVQVGKDITVGAGGSASHSAGKNFSVVAGENAEFKGKKHLVADGGDDVIISSGSAKIILKKNGDITIQGKEIKIIGDSKINVKSSSDVIIKGSKIEQN